jgi:hypothetical protein
VTDCSEIVACQPTSDPRASTTVTVERGACQESSEICVKEIDSVDGVTVNGPGRTETEMVCRAESLGAMALSSMLEALVLGAGTP